MKAKQGNLKIVLAGLLLAILMASMDNTIVATAMGTIVGELGGLDKFVWVTSAYMVAEMAGMPIFGKLSDMFGRKKFFIFGLIVFLIGSILCGTAESITQLSIYRAIQGIGGGALIPIAFTIMFDTVPVEQRGKLGGLFGAVFGLSSIFGPLLGAYITDYINWQWVFYVNIPLGLLAFVFIVFFYKESPVHSKQKIDWWGAATLVGAVISLMFALELGGHTYEWNSGMIIGLFTIFAVLFVAFIIIERNVTDPIISFPMFKVRLFTTSNLLGLLSGMAFITASVYIPIYIQGVLGGTATNSGLVLLPMMLGSVVSATAGGFLMNKWSYRKIMIVFSVIFTAGMFLLTTLKPDTGRLLVTIYMILTGLGIGATFSVLTNAAIHHFDPSQRGSVNSTVSFIRSLGMTLGITVFGIIQRNEFSTKLNDIFAGMGQDHGQMSNNPAVADPRVLLAPEARAAIPPDVLNKITTALSNSITQTFMWALIPTALAFIVAMMMSRERLDSSIEHQQARREN
ncbi:MFS transporter [Bacillus sp. CMF21]|uniref:MDR family MFS transporter n=1 Tax=Metabacillus dongyingensis TaxID=2874282 RepID=UPI001CBDC321|nr:MDR family MFS transporter [Metabacillus dongyingensis]UAL50185.1 MFS transporter [Metabacillus dongyingensis]UOK56300.1 MFS transporter [Bacillus sp. OVS6]USK26427.1 MFS transporter [Bacillus sp. CMF21]